MNTREDEAKAVGLEIRKTPIRTYWRKDVLTPNEAMFSVSGLPRELKAKDRRWLTWYKTKTGKHHLTEYQRRNPDSAAKKKWLCTQTEPLLLSNFDWAKFWGEKLPWLGVGFSLMKEDGIVCVDLDDAILNGQFTPFARKVLDRLGPTFAEFSSSRKGIHLWCYGSLPGGGKRKKEFEIDGEVGAIEMYDSGRFIGITGFRLPGTPKELSDRSGEISTLYDLLLPNSEPSQKRSTQPRAYSAEKRDGSKDLFGECCRLMRQGIFGEKLERHISLSPLGAHPKWANPDWRRRCVESALDRVISGY